MRNVATTCVAVVSFAAAALADQSRGAAPVDQPSSACALLTRELVEKVKPEPYNRFVLGMTPEEVPETRGTRCDYAGIGLQVNPFGRGTKPRTPTGAEWTSVPGVGDAAFFRPNRTQFAELEAWTGPNYFTIQMGVPTGSTPETIRPNVIELARALVVRLKGK